MFIVIIIVDSLVIDMNIQTPGNNSLVTYLKIHAKPESNVMDRRENLQWNTNA